MSIEDSREKTNADDPYMWEKLDKKKHLFSKNLSDLSIDQLKDLCDDVNKLFIAIWKAPFQSELSVKDEKESVHAAHSCQFNF